MGLFDFFKGKKQDEPSKNDPNYEEDAARFEKEFLATVPRYFSMPGATVDLRLHHPETHEVMSFAEGAAATFEEWRGVQSVPDRRGILFEAMDDFLGHQLKFWQIIERFNEDRRAKDALANAQDLKEKFPGWEADPDYWSAVSRTHFILADYDGAERCARKSLSLQETIRGKRALTDVLLYTGRLEEGGEISGEILKEKMEGFSQAEISITQFLGFNGDITYSPCYAIAWLQGDDKVNSETWDRISDEFYWSPQFRCEHAYFLLDAGEPLKTLAKLHTVAKEMPWCKEAVINAVKLVDQLGFRDKMVDDMARFEAIIRDNGWTEDDIFVVDLGG